MRLELLLREAAALLRARAGWALAAATGAALWAGTFPGAAELPDVPAFLAGIVLTLFFVRGTVARDFRTGAALLWLQHPVRPSVRYGARAAILALSAVGGHAVVVAILGAGGLVPPPASPGGVAALLLTDLAVLGVAFAVSAAGPPLESLVAALVVAVLATVAPDALLDPERFGLLAPWLAAIRMPVLEIRAVASWLDGTAGRPGAAALLRPLLHPVGWVGAGLLLVEIRAAGITLPPRGGRRGREELQPPPPSPPPAGAPYR